MLETDRDITFLQGLALCRLTDKFAMTARPVAAIIATVVVA